MITINEIKDYNISILGSASSVAKTNLGSVLSTHMYYDDTSDKISSIVKGVIKNHPFLDGNKRTSVIILYRLAYLHGLTLLEDSKLPNAIADIAANEYTVEHISKILFTRMEKL